MVKNAASRSSRWAGPDVGSVTSMGRAQADDPDFFRYAAAAGLAAAQLLDAS